MLKINANFKDKLYLNEKINYDNLIFLIIFYLFKFLLFSKKQFLFLLLNKNR